MIRSLTLAAAAGAVLGAAPVTVVAQTPTATAAAERPALVVFVTIDQLRPDYLDRWRTQLAGGLRRLVDEGHCIANGGHDHSRTETAPGHASTLSGRFPYSTGIASNSAGVNTKDAPLVGGEGTGASPFRFEGTVLADWMQAVDPRTRVLSVSRKDRGAILPVGRGKHSVFWYASSNGRFVTSSWYGDSLPTWVQRFNDEDRVLKQYAGQMWMPLLDEASYPEPDSVPGEIGSGEPTFPHILAEDSLRARNLIMGMPFMDELTLDFAWRGLREMGLGAGPQTDLLAVSLSTTDAVGHRWGPDSRELHDQVLRVDRALGVFMDSVIALRGQGRVIFALTADHGVAPSPDVRSSWGDNRKAMRVQRDAYDPALAALGPIVQREKLDPEAFTFDGMTLEVDRSKVVGKDKAVRELAKTFASEVKRVKGVMRADIIDELAKADTVKDAIARRWLHMFRPGGEVLVAITLDPFNYRGNGSGATHGTPHDYDARVPIIFWGQPFAPGRDMSGGRVVDIAPTLAEVLGVKPMERLDGQVLRQVLRTPSP
ncbi:MAG: alkaline phosphatase family protein [Gemmatimonadaceae bacterium]|nr:alkaline phosphatase family protein [Gemmatimonadaceae bacterium]